MMDQSPASWPGEYKRPHYVLKPGGWHYSKSWVKGSGGDVNHASFGTSAMVAANLAGASWGQGYLKTHLGWAQTRGRAI